MQNNHTFILPFLDLVLILLIIFYLLFIIFANPKKVETGVHLEDEYLIFVKWEDRLEDDVDVYVLSPTNHLVFFKRLQEGLMHLKRDDVGIRNDVITANDGTKILVEKNEEHVFLQGIVPGEYTVNLHMYAMKSKNPVTVNVKLVRLKKVNKVVYEREVTLTYFGDEQTAFRFTLDSEGNLISTNTLFRSLVILRDLYQGGPQ